jgi:hypothetical protein
MILLLLESIRIKKSESERGSVAFAAVSEGREREMEEGERWQE